MIYVNALLWCIFIFPMMLSTPILPIFFPALRTLFDVNVTLVLYDTTRPSCLVYPIWCTSTTSSQTIHLRYFRRRILKFQTSGGLYTHTDSIDIIIIPILKGSILYVLYSYAFCKKKEWLFNTWAVPGWMLSVLRVGFKKDTTAMTQKMLERIL